MDIKRAGWKILSVHRDEFRFAVPLFLLYFLSGSFYALGQIFTETLFLKAYGAAGLSRFFIYNGISLIAAGIIYNLFLLKIPLQRGYALLIALFSGVIFSASFLTRYNFAWLPFYLYLGNYLFTFFLDMHFFNFVFQYLTLRNSKRILPFLMAGGKLGGIVMSLLIFSVFSRDISRYGVLMWALNGILMILPILLLRRRAGAVWPTGSAQELLPDVRLAEKIVRRIKISYSSPIFAYSVMAVFVMSIVNQISEFYFASIFNSAFPSKNELAVFLSVYTFGADFFTLLVQLFFVSRLIGIMGVRNTNYVYPVSFLSFMAFCMVYPALAAGVLLRFFRKNLSLLFRTPVFNIIMASSPRDRVTEVKSFITGIVSPLGMIAGGGVIVLISKTLSPFGGYLLALGAGVAFIALIRFQNFAYMRSLRSRLAIAAPSGTDATGASPEAASAAQWLYTDDDSVRKNLPLAEAFFNENPSMDLLEKIYAFFRDLSPSTKETILRFMPSGRFEHSAEVVAHALRDGDPYIRALALPLLRAYSQEERTGIIGSNFTPLLAGEHAALKLILPAEDFDADEFAASRLGEISEAVKNGRLEPIEFIIFIQALPPSQYLPALAGLACATGDILFLKQLIPHSDRLSRKDVRRVLYAFRNAPSEYLVGFLTLAESVQELDKAFLLDVRKDIPFTDMVRFFRNDEKLKNIIIRRLIRRKSFGNKFNYLNYLLCLDIHPDAQIRGFIDYEIDTILYLKRLRNYIPQGAPARQGDKQNYSFLLMALDDFTDLHKHLMLKALAVYTGVDVEEVYESNILLKDRDLDNYILEFIETSGKVGKRALAVLEGTSSGAPVYAYDPIEILETLSEKMRHFVPEIWLPVRHCVHEISRMGENSGISGAPGRQEETTMHTLVEKIVFLKESSLFGGLSVHELFHIAKITREIELPPGRVIISGGDMGEELFILIGGAVEVFTGDKILDRLGPGSCIGELSIIDKEPRSATVKTTAPSRLLSIQRKDFLLTLKDNPVISINVMRVMAERLRKMIAAS